MSKQNYKIFQLEHELSEAIKDNRPIRVEFIKGYIELLKQIGGNSEGRNSEISGRIKNNPRRSNGLCDGRWFTGEGCIKKVR